MTEKNKGGNPAWVKGKSANPGGRPKMEAAVREAAQEMSEEAIHTLGDIMRNQEADLRVRAMAANAILDRAIGKPAQAVVHSGSIDTSSASLSELTATFTPSQLQVLASMDPRIAALTGTNPTSH